MNRELFAKQIESAACRAKRRGIRIVNTGWHLSIKNNRIIMPYKEVYIFGPLIEGRYVIDSYNDYNSEVAKRLGVPYNITQAFSDGFCSGIKSSNNKDGNFAYSFNLGKEYKEKLIYNR